MARKTISIDTEAYERLRAARRDDESFSQVIKRVVPQPPDIDALLKSLDCLSDQTVDAIERQVAHRRLDLELLEGDLSGESVAVNSEDIQARARSAVQRRNSRGA